jgi:predicted nuclease with TOPRIM domain
MSQEQQDKFQELQTKSQKITEGAIKLNAQIESAHERFKELQQAALSKFGTSDLEELKAMAIQWREQNEQRLKEYANQIENLEFQVNQTNQLIRQIQQS